MMIKEISREQIINDHIPWIAIDISKPHFADVEALASFDDTRPGPSAIALFRRLPNCFDVTDLYCAEPEACYDSYVELLCGLASMAEGRGVPAGFRFFDDRPDYEALCRAAVAAGFKRLPGMFFATSHADAEGKGNRWRALMARRRRFFERLEAKGYKNTPLAKIKASDRAALFSQIKREYNYDPEAAARFTPMDEEHCFFTFRALKLAAFCFILRPSPSQMVFDFGAISPDEKNSGVFMMPLCEFITKAYDNPVAQTVVYLFNEKNVKMLNMVNRTISITVDSTRYKVNYHRAPQAALQDEQNG